MLGIFSRAGTICWKFPSRGEIAALGICTPDHASLLVETVPLPFHHGFTSLGSDEYIHNSTLCQAWEILPSGVGHAACPGSIHLTRFNLSHFQGLPEVLGRGEKGISAHLSTNPLEVLGLGPGTTHIHVLSCATEQFFTILLQLNQILNSTGYHGKGSSKVWFIS